MHITENWGWGFLDASPCMFGIGMIVGLNCALNLLLGSVLAWGVVGPITEAVGWTAGKHGKFPGKNTLYIDKQ
jgi:uncharacterized oligopeptide transporter (OPT) family protein